MSGQLFIINGDLTLLACDAMLVPTDQWFNIMPAWAHLVPPGSFEPSWGESDMVLVRTAVRAPDVWLGNVGQYGDDSDSSPFAQAAEHFVQVALGGLEGRNDLNRIYPWPRRRLAVNLIGAGYGGAAAKKGELAAGLIATLESLARTRDVDIVLVTYGAKPYAAAQRARRRSVDMAHLETTWAFHPDATVGLIDRAQRLADEAVKNQLVLFMGAGVSASAGLPTWTAMLSEVATEAGLDSDVVALLGKYDPRDQATVIDAHLGARHSIREVVAGKLGRFRHFSLAHGLLASLRSKEAVTTNFDDLYEVAANSGEQRIAVLPQNPGDADGHWLLKLHGSVSDPSGIVLTRSDYLNMPRQYGALMGLVQALLLTRHMMFVGYSLSDEDFHELVHEIRSARGSISTGHERGTVLTLIEDRIAVALWSDDLDIVPMMNSRATKTDVPTAARELDIFLDLIGFLATTSAAFFLDDSYIDLTSDEQQLRDSLRLLERQTVDAQVGEVGYVVKSFLETLGGA